MTKHVCTLFIGIGLCLVNFGCGFGDNTTNEYDIVIYGGTSAGVIAAYTAKNMGKSVLLIEPTKHLGGLTTGGLGYTDIGNKYAITGLAREFYRQIGSHYNKLEQWIFEPNVAEKIFFDYIDRAGIEVWFDHRIIKADKSNGYIRRITLENSVAPEGNNRTVSARMFIDCSYEGDLMAYAGVSYTIGRESNDEYGETYNGVQLMRGHQFPDGIDPYKISGDPSSGLLWGISPEPLQPDGTGDKKIQAYNYRICLTNNPENRVEITRPAGYDSTKYELLLRLFDAQPSRRNLNDYFIWSRMPNQKTDINNRGGFSTDMIGMNHEYPEASYERRAQIIGDHKLYTQGLLYFYKTDPRVPVELRQQIAEWGYPKDEYTHTDHWSPQLYVREVRRMIGSYVMTQHNCQGREVVDDGIGMAAYTMDSHNCQRIVVEKDGKRMVKNEGNVEIGGFGPYPIAYRSIIPKAEDCKNLLVPVCLSATHIAYGSIRMEPVFMALAQSSAVAASLAIDNQQSVQEVDVKQLQQILRDNPLADGSVPEIVVDNEDEEMIEIMGEWAKVISPRGYGPSFLVDSTGHLSEKSVKFNPDIVTPGGYSIYFYYSRSPDAASELLINVFDGKQKIAHKIKREEIQIVGQTSGEWVPLGTYQLPSGKNSYVEITSKGADGVVFADAVLLLPEKN
jgi:hypothetical protein